MRGAYSPLWNEGDMAMVTTRSGIQYIAVYTLAPGIDYFWNPIPGQPKVSSLVDPDVAAAPLTDEERAAAEAAIQAKKDQQYNFLMSTTDESTYELDSGLLSEPTAKQMFVYVLSHEVPCEGGWVKGVYSTLEAAQAAAEIGWGWTHDNENIWTAEASFEYYQIQRWEVNA